MEVFIGDYEYHIVVTVNNEEDNNSDNLEL